MVHPGTLFIRDNGAFLYIPMKIGVKFEHCSALGTWGEGGGGGTCLDSLARCAATKALAWPKKTSGR
jgi:hypothetical protein